MDRRADWSPPRLLRGVPVFRVPLEFCPFCRFERCSCGSTERIRTLAFAFLAGGGDESVVAEWVRSAGSSFPWAPTTLGGRWLSAWGYRAALQVVDDWEQARRRASPEALRSLLLLDRFLARTEPFVDALQVLRIERWLLEIPLGTETSPVYFPSGDFGLNIAEREVAFHRMRCRGLLSFQPNSSDLWLRTSA